jgi:drug/metabolite transporter (DMT)-like permease
MKTQTVKSDMLLLLAATIWGFAFVAQRAGMAYVGPFTFNGIRFALGCLSLIPLVPLNSTQEAKIDTFLPKVGNKIVVFGGFLAGFAIFMGASFQQIGLVYTTAGKAGFITGLYIVIVPILGLFWRQIPRPGTWLGAILATVGLYFLSVTEGLTISFGDLLELVGAFFWAGHVLLIGWLSPRTNSFQLSFIQYAACSLLSLIMAVIFEIITTNELLQAAIPILYCGLLSVGVAYTLQVVAQRDAHPAHAAILLSLEAVFAALGGWLILGESLSLRGLAGCALMLCGMVISQLQTYLLRNSSHS